MTLTIVLPLPPVALSPNFHGSHWLVRDATKAHRLDAKLAAMKAMGGLYGGPRGPYFDRALVKATFYCAPWRGDKRYRPLDGGNANDSLKAAIDGLKDAGVYPADSHRIVRQDAPTILRTKKEHLGRRELVLEVTEWTN